MEHLELLDIAKKKNEERHFEEVLKMLDDESLAKFNDADLWVEKAQAYYGLNRDEPCRHALNASLTINPEQYKAHALMGNLLIDERKFEHAKESLSKSIELNPNYSKAYHSLGIVFSRLNHEEKAIELILKGIELEPGFFFAYNSLGNIYLIQKQYNLAADFYRKAIDINPRYASPYVGLGNVFQEQNEYDDAIFHYNEALKIKPKYAHAYSGLGNVYFLQRELRNASKYYKKAIECSPKSEFAANGLGDVYFSQRKFKLAIHWFKKSIANNFDRPEPYYNLAEVYYMIRDYGEALVNFKLFLAIRRKNQGYLRSLAEARVTEITKMMEDKDYCDVREIVDNIKRLLLFEGDCITHYSSLSVASLLILKNSPFRISEGAFLNDTAEGRELFKYLSHIVTRSGEFDKDAVAFPYFQKPFIGSFVEEGKDNDLTLWRMYGKENKEEARGAAITLRRLRFLHKVFSKLTSNSNTNESIGFEGKDEAKINEEFNFYRVAYRDNNDHFLVPGVDGNIESKLNKNLTKLSQKIASIQKHETKQTDDVTTVLNEIAYLFKSKEYQYEHEIRLIVKGIGLDIQVEHISSIPRVFLELVEITSSIDKITLGPKVEKAEEWASAFFHFLGKENRNPLIHISKLPFK